MAEVLASLKKIGGSEQYTETVLWTNPSPTASFASQNVTLSDAITNYKYIGFKWKTGTSSATYSTMLMLVTDFMRATGLDQENDCTIACKWTNDYIRRIEYISPTSIAITGSYRLNATGNNNGVNIPLEILGINELQHSDGSEIVFTNEMICTPFRNTTPSGSTLTFTEAGTYIITYMYSGGSSGDLAPQVVSGTMNIKKASTSVESVNVFTGTSYKVCQRLYIAEVTAGTVIRGQLATNISVGFAVKID